MEIFVLGPINWHILMMFEGLGLFFLFQEKFPAMLKKIFEHSYLKFWLCLARDKVSMFQTYISLNIEYLITNLESRKNEIFVASDVRKQLKYW